MFAVVHAWTVWRAGVRETRIKPIDRPGKQTRPNDSRQDRQKMLKNCSLQSDRVYGRKDFQITLKTIRTYCARRSLSQWYRRGMRYLSDLRV